MAEGDDLTQIKVDFTKEMMDFIQMIMYNKGN